MVSVCLTSFNGEKYIVKQIETILCQLEATDELIVSDDHSTDHTLELVRAFGDPRIRILEFERDKSGFTIPELVTTNFEHALRAAKGNYIFTCDQDDIWYGNKIQVCLKYLKKYNLVVHDCQVVDADEQLLFSSYFDLVKAKPGFWYNFYKMRYLGCCMAFRRELLEEVLPIPYTIAQDTWICLVNELIHHSYCIPICLSKYRRHGSNVSNASNKSKYSLWYRISYRIPILFRCFWRYLFVNFRI